MSDTENTQNQLSNIEAGQIELLTERIISNKPSDAEIIYNKRKHLGLTQKEFADKIKIFSKDKSKTKAILCEKNASEIDLYFMEMFKNGEI